MIKLVKVPDWVYRNCIYDKRDGLKLSKILRNIDIWESSGKIKYQYDVHENIGIFNKISAADLTPVPLSGLISKETEYPIFHTTDSINHIMNMVINRDIINDMMFLINYILTNITDPFTGVRNPNISKSYIHYDDNLYFSNSNIFYGENVISAFFAINIYSSIHNSIVANDEWICIKLEINDVMISEHDKVTDRNNTFEILDKMIN